MGLRATPTTANASGSRRWWASRLSAGTSLRAVRSPDAPKITMRRGWRPPLVRLDRQLRHVGIPSPGLEQPKPDLADCRERRYGVPQHRHWHLSDDGDRCRVHQFSHLGPDEGGAEENIGRPVDDKTGAPRVAVALQCRAGHPAQVVLDGLHVDPARARLGRGETDRRHLRVAERHLRHHVVVGQVAVPRPVEGTSLGPRPDHRPADAGLVLAHVREQRPPVEVADGVQPVVPGDGEVVVHRHEVRGSATSPSSPRSSDAGTRPAATTTSATTSVWPSDDQFDRAAVHAPLAGVGRRLPADPFQRRPEPHVDAQLAEPVGDQRARERLVLRQQRVAAHQHGDLGAERAQPHRGLARHDAAADDGDLARHLVQVRRVAGGPGQRLAQARHRQGSPPWSRWPGPPRGSPAATRCAPSGAVTVTSFGPLTRPRPRTTSMPTDRAHSTCEVSSWLLK